MTIIIRYRYIDIVPDSVSDPDPVASVSSTSGNVVPDPGSKK